MSITDSDIAAALELFEGLGPLTTRKMMGGLCVYSNGTIFALLRSDGRVLLKGKGAFIPVIEAMGGVQWTYQRDGAKKTTGMPYWSLPDAALDDPDLACDLARQSLAEL